MKIFVIQPGSSTSTSDVYMGLVNGLKKLGHEVLFYNLDVRIARAGSWLEYNYEAAKDKDPPPPRPTSADVLFQACADSIAITMFKEPDWVLVVSAMFYPKRFLKMLKQAGQRLALVLTESPYDDDELYSLAAIADVAWTNERTSVERLRAANPNTYYLAHAYQSDKHSVNGGSDGVKAHDVVFVGTGFQERIDLLESVDWTGIDFGLYGSWDLRPNSKLKEHLCGEEIPNETAAALYRKAKIGLNLHRTSIGFGIAAPKIFHAESLNPRAYELAACGCFHLSDYREELRDVFGEWVPTFNDGAELTRLLHYWLENEKERKEYESMLPKVVEGHTWLERAKQVVSDLERHKETAWMPKHVRNVSGVTKEV